MKMKLLLSVLVITINSFGSAEPIPIPEANELHPDLYTIQFTLAELKEGFQAGFAWPTNSPVTSTTMPQEIEGKVTINYDPAYSLVGDIQRSNPTYSNYATVHVSPGESFSIKNETLKGVFDLDSGTLNDLHIKLKEYKAIELSAIAVDAMTWHVIVIGGYIGQDGKEDKYAILIKLYEPKKQSFQPGHREVREKAGEVE